MNVARDERKRHSSGRGLALGSSRPLAPSGSSWPRECGGSGQEEQYAWRGSVRPQNAGADSICELTSSAAGREVQQVCAHIDTRRRSVRRPSSGRSETRVTLPLSSVCCQFSLLFLTHSLSLSHTHTHLCASSLTIDARKTAVLLDDCPQPQPAPASSGRAPVELAGGADPPLVVILAASSF